MTIPPDQDVFVRPSGAEDDKIIMELIVISSPHKVKHEAEAINSLFESGLAVFHLRKPGWSAIEMEAIVSKIRPEFLGRVSIHSNHTYSNAWGIRRLHFRESDRIKMPREIFEDIATTKTLSTSVHHVNDIAMISTAFAYTFCSPVFPSISKPGYTSDEKWKDDRVKTAQNTQLIALGGIMKQNLHEVFSLGFKGAAMIGTVWNSGNPVEAFRNLQSETEKLTVQSWTI